MKRQNINLFIFLLISSWFTTSCKKQDFYSIANRTADNLAIEQPTEQFNGYKVPNNIKSIGAKYFNNSPVLSDLIVGVFQKNYEKFPSLPQGDAYCVFSSQLCNGDFNNDGYIDVFNGGTAYGGKKANIRFLIYNPITKIFDEKNLINDSTSFIGAPPKVEPVYLNSDNYTDLLIFNHADEGDPSAPNLSPVIAISDGNGGYDLKNLDFLIPNHLKRFTMEGGDIGDLNNDGSPDLFLCCNSHTFIFWGIKTYPYFTNIGYAHFASDTINFSSNNGFSETFPDAAGSAYSAKIEDVNKDGLNDILIGFAEDVTTKIQQKILINQGNGRFNKNGLIKLPYFTNEPNSGTDVFDYVVDDLNGDNRMDVIALNNQRYQTWNLVVYIQQTDGQFKIDESWINYAINNNSRKANWKFRLVYFDFNKDGKKDLTYLDAGIEPYTKTPNDIKNKTVFIRSGNQFVEKNIYEFDQYAKGLIDKYYK